MNGAYNMYGRDNALEENLKGRNYLEDLSEDGKVILKCTFRKYGVRMWIGFIWLRLVSSGWLF
jgi:hypothetical protein